MSDVISTRQHSVVRVGDMEIIAVTDATLSVTVSELFGEAIRRPYGPEPLGFRIGSYVIRTPTKTLLLDTGIGPGPVSLFGRGPFRGNLIADMSEKGTVPESVDMIVFTHLHLTGWNFTTTDGVRRPTFPKARYLVDQSEWRSLTRDDVANQSEYVRNQLSENVHPLRETDRITFIDAPHEVTDGVTLIPAPGHTPGHLIVQIESRGEKAMCWGEVATHPLQVESPHLNPAYDWNTQQAIATRRKVLAEASAQKMLVAASHFAEPGFGSVERAGDRLAFRPLAMRRGKE